MKIVRYAMVGASASAVDFVLFAIFAKFLGYNYLVVGAITFTLATVMNYFLSIRFVFNSGVRFSQQKEFWVVFFVSTVGLGVNQAILFIGIGLLGTEMLLTKLVANACVFGWNYSIRRFYIFKPKSLADQA